MVVSLGSTLGFLASGPSRGSSVGFTTLGFSLEDDHNHEPGPTPRTHTHEPQRTTQQTGQRGSNGQTHTRQEEKKHHKNLLHIVVFLAEVGEHVSMVTEDIAAEHLDVPLGAELVDAHRQIPGTACQTHLERRKNTIRTTTPCMQLWEFIWTTTPCMQLWESIWTTCRSPDTQALQVT